MIKLLFVDHTPFAGGAQLVLAQHIAQLDKTQFEVHIACTDTVPQLVDRYRQAGAIIHIVALGRLKAKNPAVLWRLMVAVRQIRTIIGTEAIDIAISNTSRASYIVTLACLGRRTKVIWWIRDFLYNKLLFRVLSGRVSKIICVSHAIKLAYCRPEDIKAEVVYVASDLYRQLAEITPAQIMAERAKWGLKPSDMVVGFMGRLVAEKGPQDLVEAILRLRQNHPQIKTLIVGTGHNQMHDVEAALKDQVAQAGAEQSIIFTGFQDQEALYYSLFDIFVLTTRDAEPFATTVVQAMMAGKPVIGTDAGGTRELVVDGETGLLIKPDNPTLLATAITRLVDNKELAATLAQAGQKRAMDYHREDITTAKLTQIYQSTLD